MTVSTPEQHEQRASHDASEGKHNVCQGRLAALADAAVSEKLGALPGWQSLTQRFPQLQLARPFEDLERRGKGLHSVGIKELLVTWPT